MSDTSYRSYREARRDSLNALLRQLGAPPLTGNDNTNATFDALTDLKDGYMRRSATAAAYSSEQFNAHHVADQLGTLLDALDTLRRTAAWGDVRKAFKGFGDE